MKHQIMCGNKVSHHRKLARVFLIHEYDKYEPQARCKECYDAHINGWKSIDYIQVTYEEYLIHEIMRS
jgi:hypothetical protein